MNEALSADPKGRMPADALAGDNPTDLSYRAYNPVDRAHVDGNLVSAPAWPAHPDWLAKFLQVLGTRIEP